MMQSEFESERPSGRVLLLTLFLSAVGLLLWILATEPSPPSLTLASGMLALTGAPFVRSRGRRMAMGVVALMLLGVSVAIG